MREWEFDVDSEKVDLDRLGMELNSVPTVVAMAYMEQLAINAPVVYERYKEKELARRREFQIWNWKHLDTLRKEE